MRNPGDVCKKCGGPMKGPTYCSGRQFECRHDARFATTLPMDHLVYRCEVCGFVDTTPTRDAVQSAAPPTPAPGGPDHDV